jgi:hypothetical protein
LKQRRAIFGATLELYAHDLSLGNIPIGSIYFTFYQTINDGNAAQNADGLFAPGATNSLFVYEGATVTGGHEGLIIGHPTIVAHYFFLPPGDDVNGFLGNPVNGVPEPATWALMAVGFAALGLVAHRAREVTPAVA